MEVGKASLVQIVSEVRQISLGQGEVGREDVKLKAFFELIKGMMQDAQFVWGPGLVFRNYFRPQGHQRVVEDSNKN